MRARTWAPLMALLLVLAACGDGATSAELPPVGDDAPQAAGACEEGTVEECNDTLFPGDEPVTPPPSGTSSGMPIPGGGLTIAEALETDATGILMVTGFYFDDGDGPMLCEMFAESLPPQCGGATIALADITPIDPDSIRSESGVSWTDQPVIIVGEIVDGILVPTPMSS